MSKLNQGVIEWYAMYNDVVKTGEFAGSGLGAGDNRAGNNGPAQWNDPLMANRFLWENKYVPADRAGSNPIAWNEFLSGGLDMKTRDELLRQKEAKKPAPRSPPPEQPAYESPPRSRDKFAKTAWLTKELVSQYSTGNKRAA